MKQILRWILSISLLVVAVPSLSSMDLNEKAGMEEIELPYLTTGDLVCMKSEDGNELAAMCDGQWLFVPTDDGLVNKSKHMALRAWRVNG